MPTQMPTDQTGMRTGTRLSGTRLSGSVRRCGWPVFCLCAVLAAGTVTPGRAQEPPFGEPPFGEPSVPGTLLPAPPPADDGAMTVPLAQARRDVRGAVHGSASDGVFADAADIAARPLPRAEADIGPAPERGVSERPSRPPAGTGGHKPLRAPPAVVELEPGEAAAFSIARDHINRIVTPFAKPTLRTTSTASTSIESTIVYVASSSSDPISLFIFDESDPEQAIALTLTPLEGIPAVSTRITLAGQPRRSAAGTRRPPDPERALAREREHPYLDGIGDLLQEVAKGRVPDGYGYEPLDGDATADAPHCDMPWLDVRFRQRLTGAEFDVWVARAVNTAPHRVAVRQDGCAGTGVRALAAWPLTALDAGETTELYLLVGTDDDTDPPVLRPSLLGEPTWP